jgi:biopolymer transport protein ExbD
VDKRWEPIGLRREQFGLVAAICLIGAWIPNLVSMPQLIHIVKMDFEKKQVFAKLQPMRVTIFESGEVQINGEPSTLDMLADAAAAARSQSRPISFQPDACAIYDVVLKSLAVLKRSKHPDIRFATPDYPTAFGKAAFKPTDRGRPEYVLWKAALPIAADQRWRTRPILSTNMTYDDCSKRARPASVVASIS